MEIFACPEVGAQERVAIAHIDALRKDLRFYVAEPRRWLGPLRKLLAARAIQGSNSIEGYNVSVEDAVAAVEGDAPTEATGEDWFAVTAYQRAMTYVLQLAHDDHFEYSAALLRSLHFMMTDYDVDAAPGLWRPGPIWVQNDDTGEVVYEAPENDVVPGLVDLLVGELEQNVDERAIVRAAMAHLNLVMIHPFRDGNGRMARCLQTLVLVREGILVSEFASIEEYLGRNTQAYYRILRHVGGGRWNPHHDALPWVRFCLEAHYVQAASVLRRVRESEWLWAELEERVRRASLPGRAIEAMYDATLGLRVRNSSYRSATRAAGEQISNETATRDLRLMVEAGMLTRHGAKRGTYYTADDELVGLRVQMRRDRQPITAGHLFDPSADVGTPPRF
jgi:Fic family protein